MMRMWQGEGLGWARHCLSILLVSLFLIAPVAQIVLPTSVQASAAATVEETPCPLHQSGHSPAKKTVHHCLCVLCAVSTIVTGGDGGPAFDIPPRRLATVATVFATGVSATHGPFRTSIQPTGPPAA